MSNEFLRNFYYFDLLIFEKNKIQLFIIIFLSSYIQSIKSFIMFDWHQNQTKRTQTHIHI